MGKLITIPTAVGWRSDETIQLTVVHRHHKINFCQKITLSPFNYSFTQHLKDAACKMGLFSDRLLTWTATSQRYVQHKHQCLRRFDGTCTKEAKNRNG